MDQVRQAKLMQQISDQRSGSDPMNATGKEDEGLLLYLVRLLCQNPETALPEREARTRTCVATTLSALQNETTATLRQLTFE